MAHSRCSVDIQRVSESESSMAWALVSISACICGCHRIYVSWVPVAYLHKSSPWPIRTSFRSHSIILWASQVAQRVKNLPAMLDLKELWDWSLGQEDPLEEGMAIHFSILVWEIPWKGKPVGLQSMGSQRDGHNWSYLAWTHGMWKNAESYCWSHLRFDGIYFLPVICTILNQSWNHIYVILWPTLNEMQKFELLVGSNKATLQYNNLFKNIM